MLGLNMTIDLMKVEAFVSKTEAAASRRMTTRERELARRAVDRRRGVLRARKENLRAATLAQNHLWENAGIPAPDYHAYWHQAGREVAE